MTSVPYSVPWLSRCLGTPHPPYPITVLDYCRLTLFTWPGGLLLALAAALFALVFALTAQYGFGFKPCVLCLWQRVPYALVLPIALIGLLHVRLKPWRGALLLACALCFLGDAGIAAFHFGVEQRWWLGTTGCAIHASGATEPATLRLALLASPVARCDEIAWRFLGLSMTGWNFLYAFSLSLLTAVLVWFGNPCTKPAEPTV